MKAYKCDICKKYCDEIKTIHGILSPYCHLKYAHVEGTSLDCCIACYDEVMGKIAAMIAEAALKGEN